MDDLTSENGTALDPDTLVVAGQALTWQAPFTSGPLTALPLTETSAVVFGNDDAVDPTRWHDRFARGLTHRMAGEITIATVSRGLLDEVAGEHEENEMLGSAIDGLAQLLTELEEAQGREAPAARIVADACNTHAALMGTLTDQRTSVRSEGGFTVHTVRSTSADLRRPALERVRARVGLPWPTRRGDGVGGELGLARWCTVMQMSGHQMWSRLEHEAVLVTDLWLRNHPVSTG
ncbi:hypothetical protein [Actinomadura montaniterrae]|uniref:Uncharacterized protein n=1 Tax=Actinomadura montaniterrae TaxID=1803903 RepID=A0A6L3W101_9ACTN|nr:hypothetical protein [Actinomadura montaniterrae]KAB2385929.1 hypothetical protein F9B16_09005 [Actinomadura montaniterrae]